MNSSVLAPLGARLCALGLDGDQIIGDMARAGPAVEEVRARCELKSATDRGSFDVLLSGWAYRFRYLRDGARHLAGLILPGEPIDVDAVEFGRSNFQLGTLTRCVIASIDGERFRDLSARSAAVRQAVTRLSMAENAMLREWNLCLAHGNATQRLAYLFCELQLRLSVVGAADEDGYEFPLTQAHVAELLGMTAVHVNRTLQALRAERLVELSGQRLVVPDWKKLAALADFNADFLQLDAVPAAAE
jgi:CRP-like cAMP-binding protein